MRQTVAVDLALIDHYDTLLTDLGAHLVRTAKQHDREPSPAAPVPGIGKVLALAILYEIHDMRRFARVQEFASYARAREVREGVGREAARHLRQQDRQRASQVDLLLEAAVLFVRHSEPGKELLARLETRHGKGKALTVLAHKLGRAAYYLLLRGKAFEIERFVATVNVRERGMREPVA